MDNYEKFTVMWGSVTLPVMALMPEEGRYIPVWQNEAAGRLSGEKTLLDSLPDDLTRRLTDLGPCPVEGELPFLYHKDRSIYSLVPFAWEQYRVCMLHDITDYYEKTQQIVNEAIMANQAKTSFLSEMSHDIRTPMGAIIGMTEIALMQEGIPARVKECLGKIKTASGHMMSLLNEVLDMSRIESGRIMIQEEDVDLADIIHEILTVVHPQADAGHLEFRLKLGRLKEERLRTDGVRLKQICLNLLSNSIKFTPPGGHVEMAMEVVAGDTPDQVIMNLSVRDDGIGMSPEFLKKVFVAFEREEKSTVNKIQGTGLGMAITKNLVDLMGGTITVESRPKEGTCFHVKIPFQTVPNQDEAQRQALEGKALLLLDNDKSRASLTMDMLSQLGIRTDWAASASMAVDDINDTLLSGKEYFALLTVEKLPDTEILLFLPQIRQRMGADFPILLMSENDWSQLEYVFTQAGVDAFIPLPLFRSRLSSGLFAFTDEARLQAAQAGGSAERDFHGKRILLAEDNEINREIAVELLGMANLRIETVENGLLAVERFSETAPYYYDMILMDIQMPVMNGLQAATAIRNLDRTDAKDIPIVAMTANAFVEDVRNSLDAGMNAHIAKPLDMSQVYSTLELFLGRSGR